jgi:glycosyltransferase involved in cell wall biosynthesis
VRVLITGDNVGGVFTYVCELAAALAGCEVEVVLAVMGGRLATDQRHELRRSGAARVFADEFRLEWMEDPWHEVARADHWLLEIADEVEPDVVHLNEYAHAALPWRAPTLVVGHSCVLSWHEAVRARPAGAEWERYRVEVRNGLRAADLVAAPTRAMLDELVRLYRPRAQMRVIPNGRRASGIVRAKEPFVLAAGRLWDEAKNLAALDRVAPRLDWPVLVAGDEPGPRLRPRHVVLLGRVNRAALDERLARASVFAAPALYEPFGLGPLEAALAGCTLVLGDIPSLREVWGDAALFADPRDDDALADALRLVISDTAARRRLARAAAERARRFTPKRMAEGYLDAYERLVTAARLEREEVAAAE